MPGTARPGDIDRRVADVAASPTSSNKAVATGSNTDQPTATLVDAWERATQYFADTAKYRLTTSVSADNLEEAISNLAAEFEAKPQKSVKRKRLEHFGRNVIDGIMAVGGIVAQASTPAFPPAGLCFSALSFVLDASRRVSGVFDVVLELFEEIEDFLVIFKILRRIDRAKRLDSNIVEKASRMLISLVEICALTINMIDHRKWTSFKAAVFSNDSNVGDKLTDFRKSARKLDQLTNTVSLEHIMRIEAVVTESNEHLASMAMSARDQKTEKVNASRLQKIDEKLWPRKEREVFKALTTGQEVEDKLLSGTLESLQTQPGYIEWCNSSPSPVLKGLCLSGESGTGKSWMFHALRGQLEKRRQRSNEKDPVYVAHHSFAIWSNSLSGPTSGTDSAAKSQKLPTQSLAALRAIAYQIARQSTRYASALEKALDDTKDEAMSISQETDVARLWKRLQLSTFDAPDGAILYLLFDDIDYVKEYQTLLSVLGRERSEPVNVRSFFTASRKINGKLYAVDTKVTTTTLLPKFVSSELLRLEMFQHNDKRSLAYRQSILTAAEGRSLTDDNQQRPLGRPAPRMWSFKVVQRQLERIKIIYDRNAPASELTAMLEMDPSLVQDQTAKENLLRLTGGLSLEQKAQINHAITWVLYKACDDAWLEDIEALLILADCGNSLQSFTQQVGSHFSDLFERSNGTVRLKLEYEEILCQDQDSTLGPNHAKSPQITLNMSIENADEAVVRDFIWQLNDGISSGKFDFTSGAEQSHMPIYANKLEGNITIVKLCLKLLNEGWDEDTAPLLYYARSWIPYHFVLLYQNLADILHADRFAVTQGLVDYLRDPYHLFRDPDRHFGVSDNWFEASSGGKNLRSWLRDTSAEASSSNRRWIAEALRTDYGKSGYMRDVAVAVAEKWVSHSKADAVDRRRETGVRTTLALEWDLFQWLDAYLASRFVGSDDVDSNEDSDLTDEDASSTDDRQTKTGTSPVDVYIGSPEASTPIETPAVDVCATNDTQSKSEGKPTPSDDGKSVTSEASGPSAVVLPAQDRDVVLSAAMWARPSMPTSEPDGQYFVNVGYTYVALALEMPSTESKMRFLDKAHSQFLVARQASGFQWQAFAGLGRTAYARRDRSLALNHFSTAIDSLAANQNDDSDETAYVELLQELALIYEEIKLNKKAVHYYAKSLQIRDDEKLRWRVMQLISRSPEADTDLELLSKWAKREGKGEDSILASNLSRLVALDPSCEELKTVLANVRYDRVNTLLQGVMGEVVQATQVDRQTPTLPGLWSCLGILQARGPAADRRASAASSWREALAHVTRGGNEDDEAAYFHHALYLASRGLAVHEFEESRSLLAAAVTKTVCKDEAVAIAKQGEDSLRKLHTDSDDFWAYRLREDIEHLVTATYVVSGQTDLVRSRTRTLLDIATEILLDDDPYNDLEGIKGLLRVFCTLGDGVGALSAFSLLDRRARTTKPSVGSASPTIVGEDCPLDVEDGAMTPTSPNKTPERRVSRPDPEYAIPDHLDYHNCESCGEFLDSLQPEGLWWCQFCWNIDLCAECHREFAVDRSLHLHFCHPDHNFIRLFHTEYEPEEIAEGQVKIGWKRADTEDGSFRREGGEVVAVSTWMERLRVEWGLPARPESAVKAQK